MRKLIFCRASSTSNAHQWACEGVAALDSKKTYTVLGKGYNDDGFFNVKGIVRFYPRAT
jgi:hypothetical protein